MKGVWVLLVAAAVAGCAPELTGANEAGGIINHAVGFTNQGAAFQMADAHCHQYGKVAKVTGQDSFASIMRFECVTP